MAIDMSYLVKHGQQYRVQVTVPAHLRAILGKAKLVAPLHTDSAAIASREKHKLVYEFKQQIEAARVEAKRKAKRPPDPVIEEGLTWRLAGSDARKRDDNNPLMQREDPETRLPYQWDGEVSNWGTALEARYEEICRREGETKAELFLSVATAAGTPISALVDDWLAEKPMKPRQKIDYRRAVTKFEAWAQGQALGGTAEAIGRRNAGEYKTAAFVRSGANWRTANKDISALSGYWKWLVDQGIAPENIWKGMLLPKLKPGEGEGKRPYRDVEVAKLLSGKTPSAALKDAMLIAALSGMRISEVCGLKVGHISGDTIDLRGTKTRAARRVVPVHAGLIATLARRCEGKEPGAFLFDELPTPPPDSPRERSQPIVKAFTRYRRGQGIDERAEGARQSNVDLHSFRRWFVTKAAEALNAGAAGFSPWTIAEVVGHAKDDMPLPMTMSRYKGDDTLDAKRACVAAVKLPT